MNYDEKMFEAWKKSRKPELKGIYEAVAREAWFAGRAPIKTKEGMLICNACGTALGI